MPVYSTMSDPFIYAKFQPLNSISRTSSTNSQAASPTISVSGAFFVFAEHQSNDDFTSAHEHPYQQQFTAVYRFCTLRSITTQSTFLAKLPHNVHHNSPPHLHRRRQRRQTQPLGRATRRLRSRRTTGLRRLAQADEEVHHGYCVQAYHEDCQFDV